MKNKKDFNKIYKNKAEFVTDIATIDLSQVGEYDITLKYRNKEETVKSIMKKYDEKAL